MEATTNTTAEAETLTLEKLQEMMDALPPRRRNPFDTIAGLRVQPVAIDMPRDTIETIRRDAHPIVQWLAKIFRIDPWVDLKVRRQSDAVGFIAGDRLLVPYRYATMMRPNRAGIVDIGSIVA